MQHSPTRAGFPLNSRRTFMKWTKPQYQDFRFGFEITMYISAR
jgi:coenzyme PQQ precursor peptide PqqA